MCAHINLERNYCGLAWYFIAIIEHIIMRSQFEMEAGLTRELYYC